VSPILVRPVREQLEHDRVIRLLLPRYKRRFAVGVNLGGEQTAPVGTGPDAQYPDLVLTTTGAGRKLAGVVEVETGESVNQLEAMAQWARLGRLPVEFALYVPAATVAVTRRLCADHHVGVTEIWSYHTVGDQVRFAQVHRAPIEAKRAAARTAAAELKRAAGASGEKPAGKPKGERSAKVAKAPPKPVAKRSSPVTAKRVASAPAKPVPKAAPKKATTKKR
jgi:hypothetical protein